MPVGYDESVGRFSARSFLGRLAREFVSPVLPSPGSVRPLAVGPGCVAGVRPGRAPRVEDEIMSNTSVLTQQIPLGHLFRGWTPDMMRDLDPAELAEVRAELERVKRALAIIEKDALDTSKSDALGKRIDDEDTSDPDLTALMEQLLTPEEMAHVAIGFPPLPALAAEHGRTVEAHLTKGRNAPS